MFEWFADISGNVNSLYLQCAEVIYFPILVVSRKYYIDVPR